MGESLMPKCWPEIHIDETAGLQIRTRTRPFEVCAVVRGLCLQEERPPVLWVTRFGTVPKLIIVETKGSLCVSVQCTSGLRA